MRIAACVLGLLLLTSCNEPRFDGSSRNAYLASVEKMTANITPAQKSEFELALGMAILDDVLEMDTIDKADRLNPFASINGLTAQEIIEKGTAKLAAIKAQHPQAD